MQSAFGDTFLASAGDRVYLASTHLNGSLDTTSLGSTGNTAYILRLDSGGTWTNENLPQGERQVPADKVTGIAVAQRADGSYTGWLAGDFNGEAAAHAVRTGQDNNLAVSSDPAADAVQTGETPLLRLSGPKGDEHWAPWDKPGAASDELIHRRAPKGFDSVMMTGRDHDGSAVIAPAGLDDVGRGDDVGGPLLRVAGSEGTWGVLPTPFSLQRGEPQGAHAAINAIAPDNQGGLWAAVHGATRGADGPDGAGRERNGTYFFHYTDRVNKPVFDELPHPIRERITAAAGGGDGSFWVATPGTLYRYDRMTGWARVGVPGWDAGRVVTNPSPISAIAVGPDGQGLAVGAGGRIADLAPLSAKLDRVAGSGCGCGTGRDLRAAAIASDGSALVGGTGRALLYRSGADGQFQKVSPPPIGSTGVITGVAFPSPERAWLTTSTGQVFVGPPSGGEWVREAVDVHGQDLSLDSTGIAQALGAIAIAPDGHGFAVGNRGVIIGRATDGTWKRVRSPILADLSAVALPVDGKSAGALVGGAGGLILTYVDDHMEVARPADFSDPLTNEFNDQYASSIVGLAIVPSASDGQVEAFAASYPRNAFQRAGTASILHYASDADDPLMNPQARVVYVQVTQRKLAVELS
jgi:hypothetical protein